MRRLSLLFALCAPVQLLGAQEQTADSSRWPKGPRPSAPVIVHRACPFECCQYGRWTLREPATMRAQPRGDARVVRRAPIGTRLFADTGFVRIDTIGVVVLRRDHVDRMNSVRYRAGDTLLVLDYVGEGVFNGWHRDRVVQAEMFWVPTRPDDTTALPARVVREPRAQWWARVRDGRGRRGWIDMSRTSVGGADACG